MFVPKYLVLLTQALLIHIHSVVKISYIGATKTSMVSAETATKKWQLQQKKYVCFGVAVSCCSFSGSVVSEQHSHRIDKPVSCFACCHYHSHEEGLLGNTWPTVKCLQLPPAG